MEEGELEIIVREAQGCSRYDRIVSMIEESEKLKSETESRAFHLADRLAPYTLAATAAVGLLTHNIQKTLAVLMVDYFCALRLAIPISVLSAIRECGDHQINVKGGKFLESVSVAKTIIFDKTGTLTRAEPTVKAIVPFCGNDSMEMLRLAACLEEHFPHSMANAVVKKASALNILHEEIHADVEYVVAHGIVSSVNGKRVVIGSRHFVFEDENCSIPESELESFHQLPGEYSHLYLAIDGTLAAVILIEDPVREEAYDIVAKLKKNGLEKIVMMTGDSARTAAAVAEKLRIDEFRAEVLPEEKAAYVRQEHEDGRKVIMIGDGINDSPALSEADVGVAISDGAALAREIADITINAGSLESLITLKEISDALMRRIHSNYKTIMSFNSLLILLGVAGVLQPASTALLHNISTLAISTKSMTDLL